MSQSVRAKLKKLMVWVVVPIDQGAAPPRIHETNFDNWVSPSLPSDTEVPGGAVAPNQILNGHKKQKMKISPFYIEELQPRSRQLKAISIRTVVAFANILVGGK